VTDDVDPDELTELLSKVADGWTRQVVAGVPWGVSRVEHAGGRTTTLTAERLGGTGFLSANIWHTTGGALLRPCEVPAGDVMQFLRDLPAPERPS
jgi:peptide-methionine (S)-S-oxide reductase